MAILLRFVHTHLPLHNAYWVYQIWIGDVSRAITQQIDA